MKITLSPSQISALRQAPNDWAALPGNISTSTLRMHGLIALRDAPGVRCLERGFQWKITMSGIALIGRKSKPRPEPEVAEFKARERSSSTGQKTPT